MSLTLTDEEVEKLEAIRDRIAEFGCSRNPNPPLHELYQNFEILLREAKERAQQEEIEHGSQ